MSLEIHPEHTRVEPEEKPRLIIPVLLWLAILGVLIGSGFLLNGCATQAKEEIVAQVCYLRFMGKTEEGYTVVMQACQSPENFTASQK